MWVVLVATVVLLNVFMAALLAYTLDKSREREEAEVRKTVENLALLLDRSVTGLASEIDISLQGVQAYLERKLAGGRGQDAGELNALLASRENWLAQVAEIRVTDASGAVRFGHGVTPQTTASYSDREFFSAHRSSSGHGTLASKLLFGRVNKQWIHVFSRRYNQPDGSFAGVVTAAVPVRYFLQLLSGLDLGPHGIALMRDLDMTLVARHPPSALEAGRTGSVGGSPELTALVASGNASGTFYSDNTADGIRRTSAYRRLADMPAFVVVGLGEEDYLAQWHDDLRKAVGLGMLFLLVSGGAAWLLGRQVAASERANRRRQVLLQHASDGIHILDLQGCVVEASDSFCRMLGYPLGEVVGMHLSRWETNIGIEAVHEILAGRNGQQEQLIVETQHRRRDGSTYPAEVSLSLVELDGERYIFAATRDIGERKRAAENQRIAATAFDAQVGMLITDAAQVILRVNTAFTAITGYSAEEAVGRTPHMLSSGRHNAAFYAAMWQAIETTGSWQGEVWNRRKNGEEYPQVLSIGAVRDETGRVTHYVASLGDITARKASEAQIRHLALFDALTGLANRRLLMERLEQAQRACEQQRCLGALLFIDLDNFKSVNDTIGHHQGDRLLEQVAARLLARVGAGDTVARLAGDEFVVLLGELGAYALEATRQAERFATRLLAELGKPYVLEDTEYRGSASIGVALFGEQAGESVEEPLKRADLAMYQAKSAGRNSLCFFDPQMQAQLRERAELDVGLRLALEKGQFILYYQPQVEGGRGIVGAEALVRWQHPEQGLISPARFIPVAEENGLIVPLGRWVLETACTRLARWARDPRLAGLSLSVNVSASQFCRDDFVADVLGILDSTGAPPERLKLELTESLLVTEIEGVIAKMEALKARGVSFSLDDFGTGYSSLAYLKRLPFDQLKIDQSFVRDILVDPNDAEIARMTIVLAASLGIAVVAEGVESVAQRDFLAEQGCRLYQGYLFGRPVPAGDFEALLVEDCLAE